MSSPGRAKSAELASAPGSIVASSLADGEICSAHKLREFARQANRIASRSTCVYRWIGAPVGASGGLGEYMPGYPGNVFAPARWRSATPVGPVPVRIKSGVSSLQCSIAIWLDPYRSVRVALVSTVTPQVEPIAVTVTNFSGSVLRLSKQWTTPCSPSGQDVLELRWQAVIDPTSDPLVTSSHWTNLTAATFGDATWGTPLLDVWQDGRYGVDQYVYGRYRVTAGAAGWIVGRTSAYAIQRNGFYLWLLDDPASGSGTAYEVGPPINQDALRYELPTLDPLPKYGANIQYTMRQLPEAKIVGACAYEVIS